MKQHVRERGVLQRGKQREERVDEGKIKKIEEKKKDENDKENQRNYIQIDKICIGR